MNRLIAIWLFTLYVRTYEYATRRRTTKKSSVRKFETKPEKKENTQFSP